MCRMLSYLGNPVAVDELLYKPDNSFVKQTYHPKYMSHLLNLAGFGLVAWDAISHAPDMPHVYRTTNLPFYDENLLNIANKINPYCFLAHIRGVSYNENQVVSVQNVHPFMFNGTNIALAHNGALLDFNKMKYDLLDYIHHDFRTDIHGTTDSEWIYAVFISQLVMMNMTDKYETKNIIEAIQNTLTIIQRVRHKYNIHDASPVNLFITNGEFIAVTRFVFDFGWQPFDAPPSTHFSYHSLWYTYGEHYGLYDDQYQMKPGGKKSSIIIASEPLTADATTWIEVPEYTLLVVRRGATEIEIVSRDIIL
jgi:glutamine amidotransferase